MISITFIVIINFLMQINTKRATLYKCIWWTLLWICFLWKKAEEERERDFIVDVDGNWQLANQLKRILQDYRKTWMTLFEKTLNFTVFWMFSCKSVTAWQQVLSSYFWNRNWLYAGSGLAYIQKFFLVSISMLFLIRFKWRIWKLLIVLRFMMDSFEMET